jgi:hypothetical protein
MRLTKVSIHLQAYGEGSYRHRPQNRSGSHQ